MEPTPELIAALYRDKVECAKADTPESKLIGGAELFDRSCELMRGGIRMFHPDADDAEVERQLRRRLEISARMERIRSGL